MLPNPRGVEVFIEEINGSHSRKVMLFEWIDVFSAVKRIYVKKKQKKTNKSDIYAFKKSVDLN